MKLTTYVHRGTTYIGVVLDKVVVNLPQAALAFQQQNEVASTVIPPDMVSLLAGDDAIWPIVTDTVAWVKSLPNLIEQPFVHNLADIEIAAPIPNPGKIVCIGLNYHDHCREQGVAVPERPLLFAKFPSTLIGPEKSITWNSDVSQQVDYEAELALVIGRVARNVPPEAAYDYIAGYTIANDVSARDVQFSDGQWVRGKSFDTFCPLGPYLATVDEVADPHNLAIRCRLNGELMQDSNTGEMIFKIPELIAFITQSSTLNPGDVIITGTPHGVGVFRDPKVFLKPGDIVEVEIEGLGILRNSVS
ncbi:MAG: fumarylacetoacetate hydrolase family protein [Anaerolineae bacterium]|nr:fumarylacetoacetate hydrolase family protein [Anaerolineae bacterium]MCB9108072.1 fumarylacetoacetate hydrolase family protein [Anaerolineales bacterium]